MKATPPLLFISPLLLHCIALVDAQECIDNANYLVNDTPNKDCVWVSHPKRIAKQCAKLEIQTNCALTCGLCCFDNDVEACAELSEPLITCNDSVFSILCPETCGLCCGNDDNRYKFQVGEKSKKCRWMKNEKRKKKWCKGKTKRRCKESCGKPGCFTPLPTMPPLEGQLTFPPIIDNAVNGVLDITLSHRYANFNCDVFRMTNARLLNGNLPGPTIKVNAGDKMRILYKNEMSNQGVSQGEENTFRYMDHTNLHFHGGHVPGDLPSDDIRMEIPPGSSYQYETDFPITHMPGTHWVHPHVHGSAALHVSNGAALALIVKDPPGYLPWSVSSAEEMILVFQDFDLSRTMEIAEEMGDRKFSYGPGSKGNDPQVRLVNGQYQPFISVQPNKWMRWRVIYAGHNTQALNLRIRSGRCEMILLAKDGLYIRDFPRTITMAPIPVGGRADLMVRCSSAGTYTVTTFDDKTTPTLTIKVSGASLTATQLFPWKPKYPPYLHSLRSTSPDSGCTCNSIFGRCGGRFCINNVPHDDNESIHSIELGKVIERRSNPGRHSYHQHVYPFQFIGYSDSNQPDVAQEVKDYFKVGDWHDVIQIPGLDGNIRMRYHPREHLGLVMVHCHRLTHEDQGMMSWEYVYEGKEGRCDCDARLG